MLPSSTLPPLSSNEWYLSLFPPTSVSGMAATSCSCTAGGQARLARPGEAFCACTSLSLSLSLSLGGGGGGGTRDRRARASDSLSGGGGEERVTATANLYDGGAVSIDSQQI